MIEKSRKMKDITLQEISLVDLPANKRSFLLFKARGEGRGAGGSAQVDGGTKYCVCPDCGYSDLHSKLGKGKSVPCAKIKCPECGTLMRGSTSKVEKKINISNGDIIMDKRITKLLKQLFGDKEVKLEKSELNEDTIVELEKALTTINEYKEEFPKDLTAAVGLLAIHAGQGYEQPVEKAGAKLSKDTVAKIKALIASAEALLPKEASDDDKTPAKKSDEDSSELQKTIEALSKTVSDITGKLEKKESSDQLTQITEAIGKVSDRLKTLEGKPASTRKSIDDDPTEKKTGVKKDSEGRTIGHWPSLTGESDKEE